MTSNIIDSPQLDAFKQRFIDAQGWDEQEAKLQIRDGNACVENGRLRVVPPGETTPAGSHPVFEVLTPIGWRAPIRIARAILMGAHKARRPREIVEEALARVGPPPETAAKGGLSDLEIKRHCAAQAAWCLLDACDAPELANAAEGDALWTVIIHAIQFGRRELLLELYSNPELLAGALRGRMFSRGKSSTQLSRLLETHWLELRKKLGRAPTLREAARAAGGYFDPDLERWEFWSNPNGDPDELTPRALAERIARIRRRCEASEKKLKNSGHTFS
jgi:hypothetical protein